MLFSCASTKIKDISYLENFKIKNAEEPKLNIFVPRNAEEKDLPVLIYIYGGNWNSGNKDLYGFFGRNFAKKDVITVIPNYTLSPNANYDDMAKQVASAIKWTQENIGKYGGNAEKIFLTGHSAGGHLAALAVMNPKYGIDEKSISGIILNDAAGLDMKHYLEENPPTTTDNYLTTWTNDPNKWQDASPIYFLEKDTPPFLIYVGNKTYQSIKVANDRFLKKLLSYQPTVKTIRPDKKHIPMILQYFWSGSKRFDEIKEFIEQH